MHMLHAHPLSELQTLSIEVALLMMMRAARLHRSAWQLQSWFSSPQGQCSCSSFPLALSSLLSTRAYATSNQPDADGVAAGKEQQSPAAAPSPSTSQLRRYLQTKIMMRGGPLSLAEYMQDALTSPHGGFYMSRDVFGSAGDFTTSPEISQMFGEMVGAWVAHTWAEMGAPARLALVELGPGRGTLMADMLRATAGFRPFRSALEVHLVEVSPALRAIQWDKLRCTPTDPTKDPLTRGTAGAQQGLGSGAGVAAEADGLRVGVCGINNAEVTWHHTLDSVPRSLPAIFIAHELFDALPVHQFVKDPRRGWLEKLVDTLPDEDTTRPQSSDSSSSTDATSPPLLTDFAQPQHPARQQEQQLASHALSPSPSPSSTPTPSSTSSDASGLRLVLSPGATPASTLLVHRRLQGMSEDEAAKCDAIEVSGVGMALAESLSLRVGSQGGAALVVDYGRDQHYSDSLMAIRAHKGVGVLDEPGSADLSAWVDFAALRQAALGSTAPVAVSGPINQGQFLMQLGMQQRLETLLKGASSSQAEVLTSGFKRLTDERGETGGMGASYKVMAITKQGQPLPAGFAGAHVAIANAIRQPATG